MADRKVSLQLSFDENLKRDANLPTTERLSFDDLGDFIEEREIRQGPTPQIFLHRFLSPFNDIRGNPRRRK